MLTMNQLNQSAVDGLPLCCFRSLIINQIIAIWQPLLSVIAASSFCRTPAVCSAAGLNPCVHLLTRIESNDSTDNFPSSVQKRSYPSATGCTSHSGGGTDTRYKSSLYHCITPIAILRLNGSDNIFPHSISYIELIHR